ncbi:zinc finger protein 525-like [Ctenocephalides felis]|uniref:zinc finger protein 525-like n=1 Tax=Ctenocephalides felis TaxID=7515 RepID=UPI000E6E592D|nr:zinc finger protein 525-like [Ctenocephalides felis]
MSEETNSNTTIKIEPLDYLQVKQELDDYDNNYLENDQVYLQRFLKSEVIIEEEIKQETFDEQNEEIFNSNIVVGNASKSFERVPEKNTHNLKRHECEICNKTLATKQTLNQHKMIHTGEYPYNCELCNKTFATKSKLNRHRMIHTGECPYKCETCNKKFKEKQKLNRHKMIHTRERSYECKTCNKTFTTRQNLYLHNVIHTGERPYNCEICNKAFTLKQSLSRHEIIHIREYPYECEIYQHANEKTLEARMLRRQQQMEILETCTMTDELLYGSEIDVLV